MRCSACDAILARDNAGPYCSPCDARIESRAASIFAETPEGRRLAAGDELVKVRHLEKVEARSRWFARRAS